MSASFSFCNATPTYELGAGEGTGIEIGLGQMGLGLADGVLKQLSVEHLEACVTEVKTLLCDVETAADDAFKNHDFGKAFTTLISAYTKIGDTKADCKADFEVDGPALKEWVAFVQSPGIEGKIVKNILFHAWKFLKLFNEAKETWDHHSWYWTGERMGEMIVIASRGVNILYQDEIDAGITIDFEGEDYILQ